ncbi:MAG: 50S ribosomal protein L10 [Actinomycetota bacterium]|nr:50S ribosomal protein L10 [Actinomycetota bacterium]
MARPEKVAVVEKVRDDLSHNPATLFTDYRGLTVAGLADLRRQLREAGARYIVVKNTLARIAAREAGYEGLDDLLTGPTALAVCEQDPVAPAKAMRRFAREHPELVLKGGILEGRIVDAATAQRLADLESREELLGRLAGLMYLVLAQPANLLQAPLTQLARLMSALEDKGASDGAAEADTTPGEGRSGNEDTSQTA